MRTIPIIQGEHAVVNEEGVVISTLLGSCIAVCLHDAEKRIGGMNHFLLGEPGPDQKLNASELQRYGLHAMELLINATMKAGAQRQNLRAHLYGGANIIAGLGGIGTANAAFAKRFLETEGIAIGHVDTGGNRARKVEFRPYDGKVRSRCVADVPPPPVPERKPEHCGEIELF
ncbi:chemotaxis protein CheD [Stakelama pacifica]|uniref:Probable chemoreceptor glutamine deamidase CheD n=1 Tax=Stakelama pacifica TaxID=517720 RepID=A0A4R6FI83_9SPHN|nr:chemotaxis protein CheD [Stakelama pacifica]MAW98819.1 chemotaxis protein CheD [Sphingomonas sp.]MAX01198.1 chemotaxis protein CheD [Sphingomonas sp.]TDN81139.1 chemotaxis protein CheD [Stakelama pacifica]GGO96867.1 putative chemoreceptor glutamine deamidase CheD [Stakelama pacifica]